MTEKRRYSVAFIPRVTQVYDKEKDKQLSSFELDDLLLKFEKENKELKEENQHIKNTIKEAYNNERTQLGKSVLKQLIQNIGDINE